MLGRSRGRRGFASQNQEQQLNWHFQILVQAWVSDVGLSPVKDLRDDVRFKGIKGQVCDFEIARTGGRTELLECKRFHPVIETDDTNVDQAVARILDRLPGAIRQLDDTANVIGAMTCDRHLLVDISAYAGSGRTQQIGSLSVEEGGLSEDETSEIAQQILPACAGLQRVTLCYHTPIKINGRYHAIVQRCMIVPGLAGSGPLLDYGGWTVEAYPMRNAQYREIRTSTTARSLSSIVATFNNLSSPETFYTLGPEGRLS